MPHYANYAAMRQEVMDKGVIYIPPHRVGLLCRYLAAGCKFLTLRDSYGWVWRLEEYEMFDPQKSAQLAWAAVFRGRLVGRYGWLWCIWYRFRSFSQQCADRLVAYVEELVDDKYRTI